MACRCAERRSAILDAVKKPTTVLTAAKFVAKTIVQDVSITTSDRIRQMTMKRRG